MWNLIFSNIRQRPARACVSIMAVSLGVVLILVSVGLSYGQLSDQAQRARRVGGDFILQPTGASVFLALSGGTLPVKIRQVIEQVEGIRATTPILVKFISDGFFSLFGVDRKSFQQVSGGLTFHKGHMFEKPFESVIDSIYASVNKLDVGDSVDLLGHSFTVSGIYEEGTAARVLVPLATLQELNGTPGKATVVFIRAKENEPISVVEARLRERFNSYKITKTAEFQNLLATSAPAFKEFLTAISFISIAISFIITLLAMYSNIIERTREIGILKSLGASKLYIVQLILKESFLICVMGVVAGFIFTAIALELITTTFPTLPINIMPVWGLLAVVMALGGGSLGALYPAIKAAHLDPVKALGYQ